MHHPSPFYSDFFLYFAGCHNQFMTKMSIIPQSNFAAENTKIFVGYYDDGILEQYFLGK